VGAGFWIVVVVAAAAAVIVEVIPMSVAPVGPVSAKSPVWKVSAILSAFGRFFLLDADFGVFDFLGVAAFFFEGV
jgi:hypothetical protein